MSRESLAASMEKCWLPRSNPKIRFYFKGNFTYHGAVPCTYQIYPDRGLIIEQCVGVFSCDAFVEMVKALWAEPGYDPSFCLLVDFRQADLSLLMPEITQFSQYFIESPEALRGPAAILVSTPRETALSLLFRQKMVGVQRIQVFSTWKAACDFLGFPDLPESILTPG